MGLVLELLVNLGFELVLYGTGALLIRAATLGRVRAMSWTSPVSVFGRRRGADGATEIGAAYAVLLGLAAWIALVLWLLSLFAR